MKKLERMLLINWHYISKEMIEFSNINFLTGKNGSGKSTIIDALQLLLLGDTRGNFFNKAANDRTERTLEGYLRGEIGDDGDTGYKYLRSGKFSSYIVCEFYDTVTRKNFCIGVVFDVYNESGFEHKFFMFNGSIPENEFIGENNIPFSFAELKSFLTRKYGNKNLEICTSNTQYQVAVRGKLGGLNQKFFNLFKKAVTFTPINDIEKFIVEYVCDVKNQIDITSMQENIRQYNSLLKQVDVMNTQKNQLQEIENTYNGYLDECMKQREAQYLIWRAEKQQLIDEYGNLQKQVQDDKDGKVSLEETTTQLEKTKGEIEKEISDLTGISVRTLHYYDEIGLLKPTEKSDAGYRLYDDKALETLQQILFFREFDISLKEIKAVLDNPALERNQILQVQRKMLVTKKERMERLIASIDDILKGENKMDFTIFTKTEVEEMFQTMLEHMPENMRNIAIKEFGSIEQWKKHYMEVVSSEEMQKGYAKVVEWYGGKDKFLSVARTPVSKEVAESYNKRIEAILQKLIAKQNCDIDSFEVKELVGEYGFVMKQLAQIKEEKGFMMAQTQYYRNEQIKPMIDEKYGEGASDFFAQAIENYYKVK